MNKTDLIPLTQVAEELGVSRTTLWRATGADIPGFPAPTVIRRRVFWKRGDLGRLEAAFLLYEGRCAFERNRIATRKIEQMHRSKRRLKAQRDAKAAAQPDPAQASLFD